MAQMYVGLSFKKKSAAPRGPQGASQKKNPKKKDQKNNPAKKQPTDFLFLLFWAG
jgi:hypothetical protein